MTADVVIAVAHCTQALLVPNAALRVTEADVAGTALVASGDGADAPAVFVLRGDRPERVAVSLGISNGVSTAVVAAKLTAGDAVITQVERAAPSAPGARSPLGGFGPPAGIGRKRL
jgi:hypothetical protein